MLYIALFISLLIISISKVSVHAAPGDDFNLANFYLEEPSHGNIMSGEELEDGYTDKYFYSSGSSMMFYVPTSGDDKYPRCELREQCKAGRTDYNWDLAIGRHELYAEYEIGTSTTADKIVIAQIHTKGGPTGKPLLKVKYNYGYIQTELYTNSKATTKDVTDIKEDGSSTYVGKGNKFSIKIQVKNTELKVWLDGDRMIYHDVSYWDDYLCYFKAGNYKNHYDSDKVKSYVKISELSITHTSSSSCKYTSSSFLYDTDANENYVILSTAYIILIVIAICGICICCICGYRYYKKKKKSNGEVEFKEDSNDDTPKPEDGMNNETQTGAYDMTEIEVELEAVEH